MQGRRGRKGRTRGFKGWSVGVGRDTALGWGCRAVLGAGMVLGSGALDFMLAGLRGPKRSEAHHLEGRKQRAQAGHWYLDPCPRGSHL